MFIDLAKMAKIHKFGLANSLQDSPMATANGNPALFITQQLTKLFFAGAILEDGMQD